MKFRYLDKKRINDLPKTAGVYCFKDSKNFLYIGKAGNIKTRVKNHFQQPTFKDDMFLSKTKKIGFIETNSEIEALILESELIKKYKPKYNTLWKDDKNYFYVAIEPLSRVYLTHQPKEFKIIYIGPFVDGKTIKQTLKIFRRIFPYYTQKNHPREKCSWCHLKLCPGPNPDPKKYKKNLKNLENILKGKKNSVLNSLKKEMQLASKKQDFERAGELRNQLYSLEKTLANSKVLAPRANTLNYEKIKKELKKIFDKDISKIEAYDVSNIQGKFAVGSMVVFLNGEPAKELYRKFKIRYENSPAGEPNDTAMIKEILKRRLSHQEWPLPDLFLIDGRKGQLNAAKSIIKNIPVSALAKKNNELFVENKRYPLLLESMPREIFNLILQLRDEAHRFAITYHKKLREKNLLT